jgi:hypothetical protein
LGDFLVDVGSTTFGVEDVRAVHEDKIFTLVECTKILNASDTPK